MQELRAAEEAAGTNHIDAYLALAQNIEKAKVKNVNHLLQCKKEGKTIYGMGAPVKGNTLLNYFDLGLETIDCLVEKNTLRRNLYSPGKHIPIAIEGELPKHPDVYYVLAWNFKKEILAKYQDLIATGVEFYFPIDTP